MTTNSPSNWLRGAAFAAALHLRIIGKPVPRPQPRVTKWGAAFFPKNFAEWRESAMEQVGGQFEGKFEEPVDVAVEAVIERPKKTVRQLPGGDVDNYAKGTLDVLTKAGVWVDDTLVRLLVTTKRWASTGEEQGINVWISKAT